MSEPMAEYVRHHRCYNADPNVSIADWDRGILAIEREALPSVERLAKALAKWWASDGSMPGTGSWEADGGWSADAAAILAALASTEEPAPTEPEAERP